MHNLRKRRFFILTAAVLLVALVYSNTCNAYNIVSVKCSDIAPYNKALDGFKRSSQSKITEYTISEDRNENKTLIKRIKESSPDLILAIGLDSILNIESKFPNTPIVYCMIMNPENYSFSNRSNIYGVKLKVPIKDQIETLRLVMPDMKRLGVLYNPENTEKIIKESRKIFNQFDIDLESTIARSEKSVPYAFRKIINKIDALWLIPDETVVTNHSFKFFVLSAFANNLPLIAHSEKLVQAGALVALCPDYFDIGRQAAVMANEILSGVKVFLMQTANPESRNLIINLNTASRIGFHIPIEIVNSANKVFHSGLVIQ